MKFLLNVKNNITKVREQPTESSPVLQTVNASYGNFIATQLHEGWFFSEALSGWVDKSDISLVTVLEPFDPSTDIYSPETVPVENKTQTVMTGKEIIEAINKELTSYINGNKVKIVIDNETISIAALMTKLNNSLDDFNEVNSILQEIAHIPTIENATDNDINKIPMLVSVDVDDEGNRHPVIKWDKMSYDKVESTPVLGDYNEF